MLVEDTEGKSEIDRLVLKYMGLTNEWFLFKNSRTI
jgi:hypothetical protein